MELMTGKELPVYETSAGDRSLPACEISQACGEIGGEPFVLTVAADTGDLQVVVGGRAYYVKALELVGVAYAAHRRERVAS